MVRRLAILPAAIALLVGFTPPVGADAPAPAIQAWVPTGDFASSSFIRVARDAPDPIPGDAGQQLQLSAVRGGHTSAQLAVTSPGGIDDLRVHVDPLIAPGQDIGAIAPGNVQVRFPEYIADGQGGVIADPLREVDRVDVPAGKVQPVWFTIGVPAAASPGTYQTRVVLQAKHMKQVAYNLSLKVAGVTLPPPAKRDFHLNVWFQPDAVADQLGLPLWSDAHFAAMRPYLKDLAQHGQRVVNTAAITDPWPLELCDGSGMWHSQTYVPYHSLIDWSYDGKHWSFDFSHWDRFVQESLAAGVGPRISVFGLLGFQGSNHITYTDTRTHSEIDEKVDPGDERWTDAWSAFLAAFDDHVRDKSWADQVQFAFDERPAAEMQVAFNLVQKYAPDLADNLFAIAGGATSDPLAYDLSLNEGSRDSWSQALIDARKAAGKKTTFYTWNEPIHPNTLTQSPPVGARLLPWISAQHNLDGYLRWSYNSWPKDPYTDPTFMGKTFRCYNDYLPGDEYLIYPSPAGPVSSIRWELFRDGQEDFELLDQLARLAGADNPVRQQALQAVDTSHTLPTPMTYEKLLDARTAIVNEIERISSKN